MTKNRNIDIDFDTVEKDILSAVNKFRAKNNKDFINNSISERMKNDIEKTGIEYKLNSENFRCDEFIDKHETDHVIFAGCSNTFGEGIHYEKTWAYRLYKEIYKKESLTGYFNLGSSGASIFEILTNVHRYIRKYGMPNTIFLLLPEIERDIRYFIKPEISLTTIIAELYNQLEFLCKQSGTLLISTSWLNMDEEFIVEKYNKNYNENIDVKTRDNKYAEIGFYSFLNNLNPYNELKLLQEYTKTFKVIYKSDIDHHIYDYFLLSKNKDIFVAPDSGGHHGEGFHYAWFKYFIERYKNEKIVL